MRKYGYVEVFIRKSNNYPIILQEINGYLKSRALLPFLGAGISLGKPSCLPLAISLKKPLRAALWESAEIIQSLPSEKEIAEKHLEGAPLERLLDALHRTHGMAALEYLSVLNGPYWNENHSRLAALAKIGLLPRLVTLNFDLLIEDALANYGRSSETYCPLTSSRFSVGDGDRVLTILKPHGSFSPEGDPYAYLSATLSQAGTEPSPANEKALAEMISQSIVLLVGGYSDDDWDIFPILARLVPGRLEKVFWVQWADDQHVDAQRIPSRNEEKSLHDRVIPWLKDECETRSVLLIGEIRHLFEDLTSELRKNSNLVIEYIDPPDREAVPTTPDNTPFKSGLSFISEQKLKTLVALAMLISNSGMYSWRVLEYLRDQVDYCSLELAWKLEETISNAEHTRGSLRQSIKHMRRCITIRTFTRNAMPEGHTYVWLGYKYLCRTKRRERNECLSSWLAHFPLNLFIGFYFLFRGSRMEPTLKATHGLNVASARIMAKYYRIDLMHTWVSLLLLGGSALRHLYQPIFRFIESKYSKLGRTTNLMERGYYFLRHLEARLFAGMEIDDLAGVKKRLDDLERSYRLTQNNVQLGNAYAYRALILALKENRMEEARQQLNEAERAWTSGEQDMAAGKRRVKLFRKCLGLRANTA